jgi:histidine triad (HIT) family protein
MSDCLFCGIAAGTIPSTTVYSDDSVMAFTDINPQAPIHTLVIPKEHIDSMASLLDDHADLWHHMAEVVRRLADEAGITAGGYRVVTNVGQDGGQTVPHLHLHLLGGRQMSWPPG